MPSPQLSLWGPRKLSVAAFIDQVTSIQLGKCLPKSLAGVYKYAQTAPHFLVLSLHEKQDSANNPNDRLPREH